MSKDTLSKTLERFVVGGNIGKKADEFISKYAATDPSNFKRDIVEITTKFGMSGLTYLCKQADAELSDAEAFAVARDIVRRVTGSAMSPTWTGSSGGFEDMLSQVNAPHGGTENQTSVASPGQPPGKVNADSSAQGYPDKADTIGKPSDGWTDTRNRYSGTGHYAGYQQAPGAFVRPVTSISPTGPTEGTKPGYLAGQDNPHTPAHLSQYDEDTYVTSAKPKVSPPGLVAGQRYTRKSIQTGFSKTGIGKGQMTRIGKSDYLSSGRAPRLIQAIAFGEMIAPQSRSNPDGSITATPKFTIAKEVWHLDPESAHYIDVNVTPETLLKAGKFTKGILKSKKREDTPTSLAGQRGGAVISGEARQQAYRNEEDYGDTGDNSEYSADPYSDNPEDTLSTDVGTEFFAEEEAAPMSNLTMYEESRRKEDEDEAEVQEKMAAKFEFEADKAYRSGQYGLIEYFKNKAIAHRQLASDLRKRHY